MSVAQANALTAAALSAGLHAFSHSVFQWKNQRMAAARTIGTLLPLVSLKLGRCGLC